jgi:hypothetical protein
MKLTVRCGVWDGGKPCRNEVGRIERRGFPDLWFRGGNYEGLRWEERHYEHRLASLHLVSSRRTA